MDLWMALGTQRKSHQRYLFETALSSENVLTYQNLVPPCFLTDSIMFLRPCFVVPLCCGDVFFVTTPGHSAGKCQPAAGVPMSRGEKVRYPRLGAFEVFAEISKDFAPKSGLPPRMQLWSKLRLGETEND